MIIVSSKKCDPQNGRKDSWRAKMNEEILVQPDVQECFKTQKASEENLFKEHLK